ncbi:universal stress protein [Natrarchaeobius oligotrophus]|uniref:Universal stress protein n=1 Tax=Natrarchaeobius chitinivorans TaxID=1679083 RepID=A0A3N6LYY4_NATCH|nr:universal stress protein [Natrarchaeobius chitinivorans]RQG96083.1 universal stress protein [Natrarchaeobius chitinivorans]
MTRHLLVPMDDSEPARGALKYALSTFPDAEVTVVHAVDDLEAGYGGGPTTDAASDGEPPALAVARSIADEYGRSIETAVVRGTPAAAILESAADADVDGIVMGSQGRSGVSRMLLGSVAEAVARQSSIPVTIVP